METLRPNDIQAPPTPREEYGVFTGAIDEAGVDRLVRGLTPLTNNRPPFPAKVHLLLHSTGGRVGDGIFLYNLFRSLGVELIVYNSGYVHSIAVIAYLGGTKRKTSASASFVLHRTSTAQQAATATRLKTLTETVVLDDRNTEAILRKHITLPDELWARLNYDDLVISAEDAVKFGIAHEIDDFSPPPSARIVYL